MRLTVNLSQQNYQLLQDLARAQDLSLSDALNEVVEAYRGRTATLRRGPDGFPLLEGLSGTPPDTRDAEAADDLGRLRFAGLVP